MEDPHVIELTEKFREYVQEESRRRALISKERDRRFRRLFWLCACTALVICWTLIIYALVA